MNATLTRARSQTGAASGVDRPVALLRNGHALIFSSVATSSIGFFFWVLAAHSYSVANVGRDSAAISAMTVVGGIAQFNLSGALVRFMPVAGRQVRRFVLSTYGISVIAAILLALGFTAVAPHLAPSLSILDSGPLAVMWWVLATATWALFVLEDGVLTGLRRATWVPVENVGFSLAKIALVIPLAAIDPGAGIYLAWSIAVLVTVLPTNAFIFKLAIPLAAKPHNRDGVSAAQVVKYVPYDCLAATFWLLATSLTPLLVIHRVGAAKSALFSLDWMTAYVLYLVSINMGSSMIVESTLDSSMLWEHCRRVRRHLAKLLIPAVTVLVLAASPILHLFGRSYASGGVTTMRLLALSVLRFLLTSTAISALRVRRRTRTVFVINAILCVIVLSLTWVLLPAFGVRGAAIAWLVAQCVVACGVLAAGSRRISGSTQLRRALAISCQLWMARVFITLRLPPIPRPMRNRHDRKYVRRQLARVTDQLPEMSSVNNVASRFVDIDVVPSASDLSIALIRRSDAQPFLALKFPRTESACADLEAQSANMAALADDERLGDWRGLLPRVRLLKSGNAIFAAEDAMIGIDARCLLQATPSLCENVARTGIELIGGLHRPTALTDSLDREDLDGLLESPLSTLARVHPSGRVPNRQQLALGHIADRLRTAARSKAMEVSWTHGDFTPGNVMLSRDDHRAIAVLDWGQARPWGLPAIDVMSWLVTVTGIAQHRELGAVICDLLAQPELPNGTLYRLASEALTRSGLSHRELALWFWLHHVVGNLKKSERYARHPLWWAANVEPVLKAASL